MIKRFSISLSISSLTSKCDIPVSFIYWSNNKFIVDTIQHFKWFLLLNYIFKSFGRCIVGQYFYLFHRPSVRIDLSMPLFHLSIESLTLSDAGFSFFWWNIITFFVFRSISKKLLKFIILYNPQVTIV